MLTNQIYALELEADQHLIAKCIEYNAISHGETPKCRISCLCNDEPHAKPQKELLCLDMYVKGNELKSASLIQMLGPS